MMATRRPGRFISHRHNICLAFFTAVCDGITVAQGRVYVSTMDGRVQCFGK